MHDDDHDDDNDSPHDDDNDHRYDDHDHDDRGDDDITGGDDDHTQRLDHHRDGDDWGGDAAAERLVTAFVPAEALLTAQEAEAERSWRSGSSVSGDGEFNDSVRGAGEWVMPDEDTIERTPPDVWV
jgi:hypothetical protein